ncbi:hypothetical protein [Actinomyces bowdenii]|uniref:Uncharacterized protein n=1 Tax=Actinomyces bowdenii TaxID=131109 RepID=A0A3P1URJ0_9ACTO|nr:hypothetical protein [Actinomyces bowdenii]RRD24451.1 hypothetical protein EII10_11355 [Actinomyces bowdenii]
MHDENQHPRGRDGRWVAKPAGALPASLTGGPGGPEQAAPRRVQGLLDGPWDQETLDGITGMVSATGRGAAFGDDERARRWWRPTSYADPLDRVALALRAGREHGWRRADQMQALHDALQDKREPRGPVNFEEWATALWDYGMVREPRGRELDLDGAVRAGFDPEVDDLEDWRVLDVDEATWLEEPGDLDALEPDESGYVIVLDSRGDYWARQQDASWRQVDPWTPNRTLAARATSEALTDWHQDLLRIRLR